MSNTISPWGVCRFKAEPVSPPSLLALAEAETAVWSFAGASAAFGASAVTLTPTTSPCTATVSLGVFANAPYQTLALAVSFIVNWSGAGIDSATVELLGVDGSATPLATAPGSYPWPSGAADLKYAGSWGQDFGVGFTSVDVGSDALATGISGAEMASAETAFAYQLPLGFTAAALRFTFTLSDLAPLVKLDYPAFTFPAAIPVVVQETGDAAIVLYPSGPGVRFGTWNWWGGGAWQTPPSVRPFGEASSALDWLAWKRAVYAAQAPDSGLDAEIAALYDPVEQTGRGDLAVGTVAFVVVAAGQLTGILVNSLAETPPLAVFPGRSRGDDLQPSGPYALECWSHAKGPRDVVSAQGGADLFDPAGVRRTTPLGGMPTGWAVRRFDRAVDNAENTGFTVQADGVTYADVSPWHGYSCVLFPSGGTQPRLLQSPFGEMHLVYVNAGDIRYKWSPSPGPDWQVETRVTLDGGWSDPRMALDHQGRIELRAVQAGSPYRFVSDDDGRTWSPPTALP